MANTDKQKALQIEKVMQMRDKQHYDAIQKSAQKAKAAAKSASSKKSSSKSSTASKKSSASTYKPPTYTDAYRKGISTSAYDKQYQSYATQAEKNRATQLAEAQKNQQNALRNAYISRMQNDRALNQNLAVAGIRGGATETANLRVANMYGQAASAANADYTNSVNTINQNIDQNLQNYKMEVEQAREQYLQNQANARWQAAREDYENKYKAAQDKNEQKYQRKQAEIQRQTEYWSNYYINRYSGLSKKDLKKEEKTIKAKLKKAKTQNERIRWQQALSGIGARRGVIKNK